MGSWGPHGCWGVRVEIVGQTGGSCGSLVGWVVCWQLGELAETLGARVQQQAPVRAIGWSEVQRWVLGGSFGCRRVNRGCGGRRNGQNRT